MLGPKATSSAAQPRKRAAVSRAFSISASVRRLVSKSPPLFAFESRR